MTRVVCALGISACLAGFACLPPGPKADVVPPFLEQAWTDYRRLYIHHDGYVLDATRGEGEVTSEGQGYALLRAAWMRDEATFTRVLRWTEAHLRRSDGLYSWRWTPNRGGQVLDVNTAADADQEIAFALLLAADAFDDRTLHLRAVAVLDAIRRFEAIVVGDGWFPAAGNWAVAERIANLSYFLPYAYPAFAKAHPAGEWDAVIHTGYDMIAHSLQSPGARLVPDFMRVSVEGVGLPIAKAELSGDFSSDAMRLYWRVAVDCTMHRRLRACADPLGAQHLVSMLARDGSLFTRYAPDGMPLDRTPSISFYAMALPFLMLHAPVVASAMRAERFADGVFDAAVTESDRYYDANWVWFGMAAADGLILRRTPSPDFQGPGRDVSASSSSR